MLGYVKVKTVFTVFLFLSACFYIFQIILSYYLTWTLAYPVIVWWTPFMAENERIINCFDKYSCLLTKDRNYRNYSDLRAYLFYGSRFEPSDLPLPKNKQWALLHEESPRNLAIFLSNRTFDLFDVVSTFSQNSDFPLTLQYLQNMSVITDTRYFLSVKEKNKLLNSISPVLYVQSDCDTPIERDKYVKELMKYIKIDSYGACLKNKEFPRELAKLDPLDLYNEKLLRFIAQYKFVISFENAICEDYITEKLWRPLLSGTIPVYLGSPSVEKWLPNNNSAVLVKNFQTPKSLANYLHDINENDDLYVKFLQHKFGKIENELLVSNLRKGHFGVETEEEHLIAAFECFMCRELHEGGKRQRRINPVYACPKPRGAWKRHWDVGECQSLALEESVKNNIKLNQKNFIGCQ